MKYKKVLNDLKQLEDKEMNEMDRNFDIYDMNSEDLSDWFHKKAKSDREDSTRALYELIKKQNKLIENQGKKQIELLEKILDKLIGV